MQYLGQARSSDQEGTMKINRPSQGWSRTWLRAAVLPVLLLASAAVAVPAHAQDRQPAAQTASVRLDNVVTGYQRGGTLGFTLRDTQMDEALFRRNQGQERGVIWSARFVSRWALTDDQLDRWSAQVIGLLADEVGSGVRLGGWERLPATDVGEHRVAYRYSLVSDSGQPMGDATVVVFSRGDEVGLSGTATLGYGAPIDGVDLARLMDNAGGHS
jgi:hypothetical protein